MDEISVRPEAPSDHSAIRDLTVAVFTEAYGSGDAEADLIEQLRQEADLGPNISLVAVASDLVVGHVLFSPVTLEDFPDIPVCVLGPVGVHSQWQRQGIGSRLVQDGVRQCRSHGYEAVFVTGDLKYYSRFDFVPICSTRLHTIFESEHDMVLELKAGLLARVSGLVQYPRPWHAFL